MRSIATLVNLCCQNNWFNDGSNTQYQKLFERAEKGASFEELAVIIWLCTANEIDITDVAKELKTIWNE